MRAAVYTSFHPDPTAPGVVTVRDVPEPRLMPGSVLIEVRAAGVNPADWQLVTGEMADVIETVFPAVPGQDVAGVVIAVGVDTPEFTVGDEVMAFVRHHVIHDGTFAERVAVPAPWVARKPKCLTWSRPAPCPWPG